MADVIKELIIGRSRGDQKRKTPEKKGLTGGYVEGRRNQEKKRRVTKKESQGPAKHRWRGMSPAEKNTMGMEEGKGGGVIWKGRGKKQI